MLMEGLARKEPPARGSGSAQPPDQTGGIPAAAAHLRYLVVEAGDHLGDGELSANLPCRFGADTQILSHPVHSEAEVELVLDHCPGRWRTAARRWSSTSFASRPALMAKLRPSDKPC